MKNKIIKILESYIVDNLGETSPKIDIESIESIANDILSLNCKTSDIIEISNKDIDVFFKETMYTDLTNYYGIIQRTNKMNYVTWKSPSQMIKDFCKWKNKNLT